MLKSGRAGVVLPAGLGWVPPVWARVPPVWAGRKGGKSPDPTEKSLLAALIRRMSLLYRSGKTGGSPDAAAQALSTALEPPNPQPPRISGFAAALNSQGSPPFLRPQGSSPFSIRRQGGESAERAKKSLPATLIARKPLQRGRSKAEGTRIRQARRSPEGTRMRPGGGTNVDGRIRRDRASPRLQHRRDGGKNTEQSKKFLPGRLIARKPLHRGGGEGRHR